MPRFATILPGCFAGADSAELPPMTPRARGARLVAGVAFLALAWTIWSFGPVEWLAPAGSLVLAWFGVTHLIAGATAYQGCPELGVVPTLVLRRPVATHCTAWQRIDRLIRAG